MATLGTGLNGILGWNPPSWTKECSVNWKSLAFRRYEQRVPSQEQGDLACTFTQGKKEVWAVLFSFYAHLCVWEGHFLWGGCSLLHKWGRRGQGLVPHSHPMAVREVILPCEVEGAGRKWLNGRSLVSWFSPWSISEVVQPELHLTWGS